MNRHTWILLALLLLSPIPTRAIDCSTLPPDSLSRAECERNVQGSAKPEQQRSIEIFKTREVTEECGPRPPEAKTSSPFVEKKAEADWKACALGRSERIEARQAAERRAAEKAQKAEDARRQRRVCTERRSGFGTIETVCENQ